LEAQLYRARLSSDDFTEASEYLSKFSATGAGAEAKLKDANRRGPHWADPLKAWGDVLNKQGHLHEALVKYNEALNYAPNWAALKEARDAAAKQKSQ
jgi:hypothetical protein